MRDRPGMIKHGGEFSMWTFMFYLILLGGCLGFMVWWSIREPFVGFAFVLTFLFMLVGSL